MLDDKARWALLLRASVRSGATAVILTVLYFVVPMESVADLGSILFLASALVVVVVMCGWQGMKVMRADYPAVQGVEAIAMVVPMYLIGFSRLITSLPRLPLKISASRSREWVASISR